MERAAESLYIHQCNLDVDTLRTSVRELEKLINDQYKARKRLNFTNYSKSPDILTKSEQSYNLVLHPLPQFHELYFAIRDMFYKAQSMEFDNTIKTNYWMQVWANFYYHDNYPYENWHSHGSLQDFSWHGFYCVDTEESITSYNFKNSNKYDIQCKDNLMVMGLNNNQHRTYPWTNTDRPRITIAFDIITEKTFMTNQNKIQKTFSELAIDTPQLRNHWMPI